MALVTVNVYDCRKKKKKVYKSYISSITIDNIKITGKIMALSMNDGQQAAGTLTFVDKHGHNTDVPDGNVSLSVDDTGVATVSYDDPTNTVTVVAVAPGVTALHVSATNAHGDTLPFDDVAIEITAGDAVSGSIAFGTPTDQP